MGFVYVLVHGYKRVQKTRGINAYVVLACEGTRWGILQYVV